MSFDATSATYTVRETTATTSEDAVQIGRYLSHPLLFIAGVVTLVAGEAAATAVTDTVVLNIL